MIFLSLHAIQEKNYTGRINMLKKVGTETKSINVKVRIVITFKKN